MASRSYTRRARDATRLAFPRPYTSVTRVFLKLVISIVGEYAGNLPTCRRISRLA